MIFLCTNGRKKKIANSAKYLIDWDGNCKSGIQKKVKNILHDNWFADVVFEEFPVSIMDFSTLLHFSVFSMISSVISRFFTKNICRFC